MYSMWYYLLYCKHTKLDLKVISCGKCIFSFVCQRFQREVFIVKRFCHNHNAFDCNSNETVYYVSAEFNVQPFTLTPVCQCIVLVYRIENVNIY